MVSAAAEVEGGMAELYFAGIVLSVHRVTGGDIAVLIAHTYGGKSGLAHAQGTGAVKGVVHRDIVRGRGVMISFWNAAGRVCAVSLMVTVTRTVLVPTLVSLA